MLCGVAEDWPVEVRLRQAKQRRDVVVAVLTGARSWADVLSVIADAPDAASALGGLQERFGLDEVQATALLDMQFRRVAGAETQRLADELQQLDEDIARLEQEL